MHFLSSGIILWESVVFLTIVNPWKTSTLAGTPGTRSWHAFSAASPVNTTGLKIIAGDGVLQCSMYASRFFSEAEANFFCMGRGSCMYGDASIPDITGKQTEGYQCFGSIDCTYDGKGLSKHESVINHDCPSIDLVCTASGFVPRGAVIAQLTTCDPPFEQFLFGCMYFNTTKRDLRSSIDFCASLGSSLASLDTTADFGAMKTQLANQFANTDNDFWVYVFKMDGVFRWAKNGRPVLGPDHMGEWSPTDPDGKPGLQCVRLYSAYGYNLADISGTNKYGVACHVWYL